MIPKMLCIILLVVHAYMTYFHMFYHALHFYIFILGVLCTHFVHEQDDTFHLICHTPCVYLSVDTMLGYECRANTNDMSLHLEICLINYFGANLVIIFGMFQGNKSSLCYYDSAIKTYFKDIIMQTIISEKDNKWHVVPVTSVDNFF